MSSVFKAGDRVIIIAGPHKGPEVHTVRATTNRQYPLRVANGTYTAEGAWYSTNNMVCLRHATAEEIAATQKPKVLHRGDLVEYLGEVWVVTNGTVPTDLFAQISTLTGREKTRWVTPDAVVRVGSIRKKVKRIKKDMEGRNAT